MSTESDRPPKWIAVLGITGGILLAIGLLLAPYLATPSEEKQAAYRRKILRSKPIQTEGIKQLTAEEIGEVEAETVPKKTADITYQFLCPHCKGEIKVEKVEAK